MRVGDGGMGQRGGMGGGSGKPALSGGKKARCMAATHTWQPPKKKVHPPRLSFPVVPPKSRYHTRNSQCPRLRASPQTQRLESLFSKKTGPRGGERGEPSLIHTYVTRVLVGLGPGMSLMDPALVMSLPTPLSCGASFCPDWTRPSFGCGVVPSRQDMREGKRRSVRRSAPLHPKTPALFLAPAFCTPCERGETPAPLPHSLVALAVVIPHPLVVGLLSALTHALFQVV